MSNITNSSKKSLLEFLQYQTKDSFLQNNYSTSNQNLLEFISNIFLKNLTEDQEKKLLKLGELSKEIAKIQNPSNKTDELSSEKIKLDYFNGLRDICVQVFEKDHEIFNQINEAEQNLIFENLFIKNKASQDPRKVFTKEELNSKYGLGIAYFNNKIWKEISNSKKFKNLEQDKQDELDKSLLKIFSKLKSDSTKFKTQNKTNETKKVKTLEELQKENDKIVQEINKINEELDPNIKKEEAEKILEEIFSKINIIQNKYNALTNEQKQKLKVSYRNQIYNLINNQEYIQFFENLFKDIGIYDKLKENIETKNQITTNSPICDLLLNFIEPYTFFIRKITISTNFSNSIDFSNSNFREQLIFVLKQVASFYGIEDYKDFKLNFNLIENDQINPAFRAYKLNKIALDENEKFNLTILIPQEYIENDEKFHELEKNPKIFEKFRYPENKIEIFKKFGYRNEIFWGKFYNIIIIQNLLLSYQRKDLLEDFYNLNDEKLKIIAKFQGNFIAVIHFLNKADLLNKFFDIIKKSNDLSEIEKMANDIQDKTFEDLDVYIKNILVKYVEDYKFENQSNKENNIEFKSASNISQEQQMEYQNNLSFTL